MRKIYKKISSFLQNQTTKQIVAWAVLAFMGAFIWSMSKAVLSEKKLPSHEVKATTETAIPISGGISGEQGLNKSEETTKANEPIVQPIEEIKLPSGDNRVQVIRDVLNLREAPDKSSNVIDGLTKGTIVEVIGKEGSWYKVKTVDGVVGYITASPGYTRKAP